MDERLLREMDMLDLIARSSLGTAAVRAKSAETPRWVRHLILAGALKPDPEEEPLDADSIQIRVRVVVRSWPNRTPWWKRLLPRTT